MPCDDPEWSNFTKDFAENFERMGLGKLISTSDAFNNTTMNANGHSAGGGGAGRPALPETQINGTPVGRDVLVAPWSKGGAIKDTNRQMLCKTHNRAKGNR